MSPEFRPTLATATGWFADFSARADMHIRNANFVIFTNLHTKNSSKLNFVLLEWQTPAIRFLCSLLLYSEQSPVDFNYNGVNASGVLVKLQSRCKSLFGRMT